MTLYNKKFRNAILNGIAITKPGETVAEETYSGDFVEQRAGAYGDVVTDANNGADKMRHFRHTVHFDSPIWAQIESWAKNHTQLTYQVTDDNTGEKKTSTTAYIGNINNINDGQDREFTVYCEDVV